jgi:CRISPR-associated protein (TIGR02710 family)
LTVGTGVGPEANIVNPLYFTVKQSRPDYTVFLVSEDSKKYAEEVASRLELKSTEYFIQSLSDPDDIISVFGAANRIIRDLLAKGYECADIVADYTSGTKAMTGGLVLSAVGNTCGELKYIVGPRKDGVVINGTEQAKSLTPSAIIAARRIRTVRSLMEAYRFDAAQRILNELNPHLLDEHDQQVVQGLQQLAAGFQAWDKFDHKYFIGQYEKADLALPELAMFKVSSGTKKRLINIKKTLESDNLMITEDLLADLYNNSLRRIEESKYDDAMARMYRLGEMLGQWALAKYELSSSDVDLTKVPKESKPELEALRDPSDGKIRIGLFKIYQLLQRLDDPLGDDFVCNSKIRNLITRRNHSILAHGVTPISGAQCQSMARILSSLLERRLPDFQQRISDLRFPWSRDIVCGSIRG